jgi:hypothetical protein
LPVPAKRHGGAGGEQRLDKVILLSMLAVTFAFPAVAARDPSARRGLFRLLVALLAFSTLYVLVVTHVYARFYVPGWLPL